MLYVFPTMISKHDITLPVDEFIQETENLRERTPLQKLRDESPLRPEDDVYQDLSKTTTHQLEGRLNYYEREALFERSPRSRRRYQEEVTRTRRELERRKSAARAEAEQFFRDEALSSSLKV